VVCIHSLLVTALIVWLADMVFAGFDLAATFPKYINIRRGAYLTALVSVACNPWKLVNTATTFLAVLSSYSVFLGPMTGLMISSYFVINRRKIKVDDLFVGNSQSIYWFSWGLNWRAVIAVGSLYTLTSMLTNGATVGMRHSPLFTWLRGICQSHS
jgi:cytosine/uracil/thiamine/allantoin permease